MKKQIKLVNLDCANCAAKMENAIRNIKGVTTVSVSFMTQKLTLEADEVEFNRILSEVARICKKIEPDCSLAL